MPCIDKGSDEAFSQPALAPWAKPYTIQFRKLDLEQGKNGSRYMSGGFGHLITIWQQRLPCQSAQSGEQAAFKQLLLSLHYPPKPEDLGLAVCQGWEPWLSKHKHPLELPLAAPHSPIGQWHALNIPSGLSYVMFIGVALGCSYVLDCLCRTWHAGRFSFWWKVIPGKENVLCWQARSDDGPEAKSLQLGII